MTPPHSQNLRERIREDVRKNRARVRKLGPGLVTGGAGDDPAGIVTYTLVGATTGLSQLWLLLLSTPMMIAVQNSVARIAIVTGKSLPELTNSYYSRRLTAIMIMVLAIANILTIGADLQALATILGLLTGKAAIYFLIPVTALIAWLVHRQHDIDGYRASQIRQCKARPAGKGGSLFKGRNAAVADLGCSRRASRKAAIRGVALA